MNSVCSYLHHLCIRESQRWYPLLGVYYLTYACDFRCLHCSDGSGEPYYRSSWNSTPLNTQRTIPTPAMKSNSVSSSQMLAQGRLSR
jgi:hypothetical protein